MAKLILDGKSEDVPDGGTVKEAAGKLGVPFGCEEGVCWACLLKIKKGEENLMPYTKAEEEIGLGEHERLGCQCSIKSGEVEVSI